MAMTACFPTYDLSSLSNTQPLSHLHHHHHHHHASSMQQHSNRSANLLSAATVQSQQSPQTQQQQPQKDYSIPLHVDCSVEYELPNQAKPPVGGRVEPLLMIHPCYFRKMESQRRSPFINNMPNSSISSSSSSSLSSTSRNSSQSNVAVTSSSSRRPNLTIGGVPNTTNNNISKNQYSHSQQQQQQNHIQQHMNVNHQQNLQQQLDEYVQRQMAHISQQAQYPSIGQLQQQQQQQPSQYNMPPQPQIHSNSSNNNTNNHNSNSSNANTSNVNNWDNRSYNPNSVAAATTILGKVNIPNQNAYKKSGGKRHLSVATCANSYSTSHFEGALPNGVTRWDEKTVMATIPRDYSDSFQQQKTNVAAANMYRGVGNHQQQQAALMNSASTKRDRDPMLSGGCIFNNSNLNSDINSLVSSAVASSSSSGLWSAIQKSPMAAIPSNNYHQAGPDSIPNNHNNNHSSNSNSNNNKTNGGMNHRQQQQPPPTNTVIHHSHHQSDKVNNNNNSTSNNNNHNNVITVKYRQYRNSHRMHPYMMNNMTAPTSIGNNASLSGVSYFPQLANNPFPQMQQVSCYNV